MDNPNHSAREVDRNRDLPMDLVVLSACQTGLGRISGDGMLGLSRAFLIAGAGTVVVSQWSVSDRESPILPVERDRNGEGRFLGNLGLAYYSLGQYQRAIDYLQQALEIARAIGDRNGEGGCLGNLGSAYDSLGQYQRAIDYHQQPLEIARAIGDRKGEANARFNLGLELENVKQKSEAIDAYDNARQIYETIGLDADVQDCDIAIERLSQGFWSWQNRLFR